MRKDQNKKDYEVGYKKPPKAGQFKLGQSGNPKGRPKESRNLMTLIQEALDAEVEIREGGLVRRMKKREIAATQFVNKAVTGDIKVMTQLLRIMGEDEARRMLRQVETPPPLQPSSDALDALRARLAGSPPNQKGEPCDSEDDGMEAPDAAQR